MFRLLKRTLLLLVVVAATLLAVRAYDSQRGAPLQLWHTVVPHDMRAADIDKADWPAYLKAEDAVYMINDSRINVLSRPRIVTSTAKPASIFVGETRPYITGSYFSDFTGAGSRSQYAQTQIGISLNVLPIVLPPLRARNDRSSPKPITPPHV